MIQPVSLQFVGKDNLDIYDTPVMILYKVVFYFLVYLLFFHSNNLIPLRSMLYALRSMFTV